jgi:hypothetical protein
MHFALSTDDLMLHIFASIDELTGYCEGVDVEDDGWQFWNEAGVALTPRFTEPVDRSAFVVGGGKNILEVNESGSRLATELHRAEGLNANVFFESLGDVRKQFRE